MSAIVIRGLQPLQGHIRVQGSKNAVLPMMAASALNQGITIIHNVPRIQDVFCMMGILTSLGCVCHLRGHRLEIDSRGLSGCSISKREMEQMRSSIMLLGPLLGRCREAAVYDPGGCMIGKRPIDLHLMALEQLGAEIVRAGEDKPLVARCTELKGARITFPYPSVGATENALLAAVTADGTTIIDGAAREPEIRQLCGFLNAMGASVRGGGSPVITVEGGLPLHDCEYSVHGDRIVAGTYLLAAAGAGGEVILTGMKTGELQVLTEVLRRMGAGLYTEPDFFYLCRRERLAGISIRTGPFPEFPTDLQSVMMALMSLSEGESRLEETVFENRFRTAGELRKLGALIETEGNLARIRGQKILHGASVTAQDLRGGAALAAAALKAEGTTVIRDCEHIDRGYEDIVRDLAGIGAMIRREEAGEQRREENDTIKTEKQ